MKLGLLLLLAALILGGLVGTLVVRDPGYVLISYGDMAVETSVWLALLVLLALYLLVKLTFWLLGRSRRGVGQLGHWMGERRSRKAQQLTVQGLLRMAEGDWAEAKKRLLAAAPGVDVPLVNYLNAARAAHELGDFTERDALLRTAHETTPGSRFAIGLTQAELQMDAGQWEPCLATLLTLRKSSPRHPRVLKMLCLAYRQVEDWQALIETLPDAAKRGVFDDEQLLQLTREAWMQRLRQAAGDAPRVWKQAPRAIRRDPEIVHALARVLLEAGNADEAETVLREALNREWRTDLLTLYGSIQGGDPAKRMVAASAWVKERPNDPDLLLALGRLSLMNHDWGHAREYFETALRLKPAPAVYGELGRLCVALGDTERGARYLVNGLSDLPALPLPESAGAGAGSTPRDGSTAASEAAVADQESARGAQS